MMSENEDCMPRKFRTSVMTPSGVAQFQVVSGLCPACIDKFEEIMMMTVRDPSHGNDMRCKK